RRRVLGFSGRCAQRPRADFWEPEVREVRSAACWWALAGLPARAGQSRLEERSARISAWRKMLAVRTGRPALLLAPADHPPAVDHDGLPVMNEPLFAASNTAAPAISSGSPIRCSG